MKIEQITIQGFRGFREKITIALHPNVTVFVGVNGSGKTSVLDGIAKLLEIGTNRFKGYKIENIDINFFERYCLLEIHVLDDFINSWKLIMEKYVEFAHLSINEKLNSPVRYYFPLLVYYNINRNSKQEVSDKISSFNRRSRFDSNRLDKSFNTFSEFEGWFIKFENKENRIRLREDSNYRDKNLEVIRAALQIFNQEIFDLSYEGSLYVDNIDESQSDSESKLFIKKQGQEIRLDSLSDGEKNVILMVCDIARRLLNSKSDLDGKGVVLIDEIELHLHPGWQRKLVPALTKVFPNIQFILTTHSPQVLSNLKEENIRVIEDFKLVKEINPVYGEDSNDILWNIFGVKKRPLHAEENFGNFYKLLETDQKKAKKALNELEAIYGAEHTEVKKAQLDYEFEFGEYKFSEDETD